MKMEFWVFFGIVILSAGIGTYLANCMWEKWKNRRSAAQNTVVAPKPAPNTAMDAIAEMSKAVRCLAIELPGPVWDDINKKWNAVLAQLHHS